MNGQRRKGRGKKERRRKERKLKKIENEWEIKWPIKIFLKKGKRDLRDEMNQSSLRKNFFKADLAVSRPIFFIFLFLLV